MGGRQSGCRGVRGEKDVKGNYEGGCGAGGRAIVMATQEKWERALMSGLGVCIRKLV